MRSRLPRKRFRWLGGAPIAIVILWLVMLHRLAPPPRAMDGAEPSIQNRAKIIGSDDRVAVEDTTATPWRTIGQVRAWWGTQGFTGTGVFVSADQILTAAHCVYRPDLGGWADSVTFIPAKNGMTEPFGTAVATRFAMPREYAERRDEAHDLALVTLDQPIGNQTGWLAVAPQVETGNVVIHSAGYPADKSDGQMHSASGSITSPASSNGGTWQIDLDAAFGQSGSPIWTYDAVSGAPVVVAVLVAELDSGRANVAAPVSMSVVEQLRTAGTTDDSIAIASDGTSSVVVRDPTPADSPLAAAPIAGCGAGVAPMMVMTIAGLVALRRRA